MLDRIKTAITTLGRTTKAAANRTISLVSSYLYNAQWLIDTTWASLIREGYGKNSVVYACVKELCRGVPEAALKAYTGEDDDKKPLDRQHELMQLIRRPNELMTEYEMLELITIHLAVVGKTVWWKERNNLGRPIALWPLRPDRVGPIYAPLDGKPGQKVLSGWSYQDPSTGGFIGIPRRDTLTINFPDPDGESGGIVEGLGPLSVLSREVAADNKATEHVGALMANHAQPTVVILVKESGLTEEDAKIIKSKFRSDFGGSNLGTPGVMDGDSDIKILGFSLKDLEFPGLRDNAEARIASVLGVPAVLAGVHVGLKESNQRATTKELREYFTETTLSAYWRRYADQFTLELAADFGEDIYCEFDTSNVKALAGQRLEAMQPIKDGFAAGIVMVNQYREKLSLPPLPPEYGEVFYIPNSVTVVPATDAAKAVLDQRAQENFERQQERMIPQAPEDEVEDEGEEDEDDEEPEPTKSAKHGGAHSGHGGAHAGAGTGGSRQEKEKAIRNSPVEHSVVFDAQGNVVVEVTQGSRSTVMMGPSEVNKIRATKGAVAVHNHPTDAPPSPNDFQAAWGMRVNEIKIVSPEYDYTVKVNKYQTWEKVQKSSQKATQKLAAEQVARMRKGESLESVTKGQSETMHKILGDIVAKVPGVTYTRSKP